MSQIAEIADALERWRAGVVGVADEPETPAIPADECERAGERWADRIYSTRGYAEQFESIGTLMRAITLQTPEESRASQQSESSHFTISLEKEAKAYTGDPDDFCYVRFTKHVHCWVPGDVIATSKMLGAKWEQHAQAKVIGHDEAQAYADRQKATSGGWMDAPAWVRFRENFKRVLRAERLHRVAA